MDIKNKMILMSQVLSELEDAEAAKTAASNNYNQANVARNTHRLPAQVQEVTLVDNPDGRLNTICSTCTHICHPDCGLEEITMAGDNAFMACTAFDGTQCKNCPEHCSFTTHFHGKKKIVKTARTVESVIDDLLKKFMDAENSEGTDMKQKSYVLIYQMIPR